MTPCSSPFVLISLLSRWKARGFLVINGECQLILAAKLRRRHDARLEAEPLAAWEQRVAPGQPSLSPVSGDTHPPPPTSPGWSSPASLQIPVGTVPEHGRRGPSQPSPHHRSPRIPLSVSGHGNSQQIPGQESPLSPAVSAQTGVFSA